MFIKKRKLETLKAQWFMDGIDNEKKFRDKQIAEQVATIKTCIALLPNIKTSIDRIANTKKIADRKEMAIATGSDIEQIIIAMDVALKELML